MNWLECAILFASSLFMVVILVPAAKKLSHKLDAIDYPSARRVNRKPIPRLGGVAMFGGLACGLIVFGIGVAFFGWYAPLPAQMDNPVRIAFAVGGIVFMFIVGLVDDIHGLKPKPKLIGQIIAACIYCGSGILLWSIHNPIDHGYIDFGWLAYPITIFYLVAFANIINLIDGLDGLAAGISGISALAIFAFTALAGDMGSSALSLIIVGVCIGFLIYNFYPASIFMGDSGALVLGFSLGAVSLISISRSALFVSLMLPIVAAGIPVIDTAFAILRRLRAHKPIDAADKGHIHHQLLQSGYSQRATVLIMWGWTLALSVLSVFVAETHGIPRLVAMLLIIAVTMFMIAKLNLLEPVLRHHYNPRNEEEPSSEQNDEE